MIYNIFFIKHKSYDNFNIMNTQSGSSQAQSDAFSCHNEKITNKIKIQHKGLTFSSQFAGGNIKEVQVKGETFYQGKYSLLIQFASNSDTNSDIEDKAWFYFQMSGMKDSRYCKYYYFIFRYKNANAYQKFVAKQKRYKPFVAVKQSRDDRSDYNDWKVIYLSKLNVIQNQPVQAQFVYKINPNADRVRFAQNVPYTIQRFESFNAKTAEYVLNKRDSSIYYHCQTIAMSANGYPTYMITLTSSKNIQSYSCFESGLQHIKSARPYLLKSKPEIFVTARVHPSQTPSSFTVQSIVQNLIKKSQFKILLHFFIFRIVPIVNPQGVQNGNYRLDNYYQNLNRFYGHSDAIKTPSVYSIQKLLTKLRQKSLLFMFIDVHGHSSPKPAFIFGNYSLNFYHTLQNRTFVKLFENNCPEYFSAEISDFSKRNMSVKQKYDHHSKEASARVYAYQGSNSIESTLNNIKNSLFVQHSYTLQVHPYTDTNIMGSGRVYELPKIQKFSNQISLLENESILNEYKSIATGFLTSILRILGLTTQNKNEENKNVNNMRIKNYKQITKLPQFSTQLKRQKSKDLNKQILQRYYTKWNLFESYKDFVQQAQHSCVYKQLKQSQFHQMYCEKNIQQIKKSAINSKQNLMSINKQQQNYTHKEQQLILHQFKNKSVDLEKQSQNKKPLNIDLSININQTGAQMMQQMQRLLRNNTTTIKIQHSQLSPLLVKKNSNVLSIDKFKCQLESQNKQKQLEKKIRRLIFRHRTQVQTKFQKTKSNNKLKGQLFPSHKQMPSHHFQLNKSKLIQFSTNNNQSPLNKLQPVGKNMLHSYQKSSLSKSKSKQRIHHINQVFWRNKSQPPQKSQELLHKIKMNIRFTNEQKKIRDQRKSTQFICEAGSNLKTNADMLRVQSSQSVLSNLVRKFNYRSTYRNQCFPESSSNPTYSVNDGLAYAIYNQRMLQQKNMIVCNKELPLLEQIQRNKFKSEPIYPDSLKQLKIRDVLLSENKSSKNKRFYNND